MAVPWLVTPEKIERAVEKIIEVARPRKVVLFGSTVRGDLNAHSDLDVLVVLGREGENPRRESVRIRRALSDILIAMDILVVSEERLKELADRPGLIYREVLRHGKVVYEASG